MVRIIKLFYKLKNFFKKNKQFFSKLRNKEEDIVNKYKFPSENYLILENSISEEDEVE
jgi:hypothetical protein